MGNDRKLISLGLLALASLLIEAEPALAHASDRGHVLLLPTEHYLVGGAITVLASFVVLALLPAAPLHRAMERHWRLALPLPRARAIVSTTSFCLMILLLSAGWFGSRDPLANPLPLTFWSLIWVGFVVVQGVVGNVWGWINPWYGPWRIAMLLTARLPKSRMAWPRHLATWPSVVGLAAFVWLELVDPAPDDPNRLANVIAGYWLVTFVAMLIFGYRRWSARGEFLSVFLAIIARLPAVCIGERNIVLRLPAAALMNAPRLTSSGVVFLLLALSSVTFDGLRHTFLWMRVIGVNPLEFPGRSAVMPQTTAGLAIACMLLSSAFVGAIVLGHVLAGTTVPLKRALSCLVWTIVPISFAYHFAHYLPSLLIDGQFALVALSDPFALGQDWLGTSNYHVQAALLSGAQSVWILWNVQAATIVAGHIVAIIASHVIAWRIYGDGPTAIITQLPLVVLMIIYTVIGLWLLSTPTAI